MKNSTLSNRLSISASLKTALQKKSLIYFIFVLSLQLVAAEAIGQNTRVTGIITGPSDEPLQGVSVREKGTTNGTITDNNGRFTLNVGNNAVLEISSVGYVSRELPVNGQTVFSVRLTPSAQQLEQVVVVGYGSQRRRNVTGSVAVVTSEDIANRPIVNAAEALQGKAAGVQIVSNSGKPGAGLTVRVRGSSSISAGNDPLYVVDGIPMNDIAFLSPNDIESISILKDAASAAIYGTRAANGVVVITTKKGAGKPKVDFSTYYGISSTTKKIDVLNAQQYQEYMNEVYGPGTITDSMIKANNINWPDEVFRHGHQENYQLAFSGASDRTQYYTSLGYSNQVGIIRPAKFDRINGKINLTVKATDWLNFTTSTSVSRVRNNDVTDNASIARGGVVLSALATPPTVGKYSVDTSSGGVPYGAIALNPLTGWENPLGAIEGQTNKNTNDRLVSNLGADVKLVKGLTFQSRFGIDYLNNNNVYFLDPFLTQNGRNTQGNLTQTRVNQLIWLSEQTLNYTNSFGRNHFSALAGWTAQESRWEQTGISGSELDTQFRHQPWEQMYLRTQTKQPGFRNIDEWGLISYLGRITYDYDNKYLLQANLRSDQSSKFAPGNRTATFPSFSAGWRISQEDFMKDVTVINDLKLRAGWGRNGNQEGIGSYEYLSLTNIDNRTGATSPATIAPEDLTWETTTQTDIGIDATFLKGRLTFSGDYYIKNTKNVLVRVPLSSQIVPSVLLNMGTMKNTGVELSVSSKNIAQRDLTWNTDFNISFNRNKVTSIGGDLSHLTGFANIYERGGAIQLTKGYGLGEFYGYVAAGVDPATGDQLYLNSEGKAVDYTNIKPSDRRLIGSAQPDFVYGMTNSVTYKNVDLTVFLQGSQGNKIFNGARLELEGLRDSRNQSTAVLNRWRNPGDVTDIPRAINQSDASTQISTRFLENGSYLRFKTITLAYRFNPDVTDRLGLGTTSIYVSAQNLITITKYKGFDPEVNTYGTASDSDNKNISLGVDYGAYPQPKLILFGLNISLK